MKNKPAVSIEKRAVKQRFCNGFDLRRFPPSGDDAIDYNISYQLHIQLRRRYTQLTHPLECPKSFFLKSVILRFSTF